jgi:predicted Rossmann-fold nucleotide-binding protein
MRELDTIAQVNQWLGEGPDRAPAAIQSVDLTSASALKTESFPGSLFLGCTLHPKTSGHLVETGAVVINDDGSRPFAIHRARLYTPAEIFAGFDSADPSAYHQTFDHRVYTHYVKTGKQFATEMSETLARRLHDHSITDALQEVLDGRKAVAIMGGHGIERASAAYRTAARIARRLTRDGYLMLSGGGPGAMEAAHLGAHFAHFDDSELDTALGVLGTRPNNAPPGREYADPDWLHRGFQVLERWPLDDPEYISVGIPTWMYGHEPPAVFATHIAKYFANSVREEGLLAVATYGVIFTPGSAGTIQEIFQDACQNHYGSFGVRSPMILLGKKYWTETKPVWPLLAQLAEGQIYRELLCLTDSEDTAVQRIHTYNPDLYRTPQAL